MRKTFLVSIVICGLFSSTNMKSQSYYTKKNTEINLESFLTINGQWQAVNPTNSTLGANYYQGLNFGFDINNYASIVNPVNTDDLYFGRWSYSWKGWNKIWHSGNLNNFDDDFKAKNIAIGASDISASLNIFNIKDYTKPIALKIFYDGSWGTPDYASNYRFVDISSDEGGNILEVNGYGIGVGFDPPNYKSNDKLYVNGNVGIGTNNVADFRLAVNGKIRAKEIVVETDWADFVFDKDYELKDLEEVETFIEENNHLPDIPSEKEVLENGIQVGVMNAKLLQKIEELTLYVIEQNKQTKAMKSQLNKLSEENKELKTKITKLETAE